MKIEEFIGEHFLSGVDIRMIKFLDENRMSGTIDAAKAIFILDGITFEVLENPDDGYRSYMEDDIYPSLESCMCRFLPVMVDVSYKDGESFSGLIFKDHRNGKTILELGTDWQDDYYPVCVFHWTPENIQDNESRATIQ